MAGCRLKRDSMGRFLPAGCKSYRSKSKSKSKSKKCRSKKSRRSCRRRRPYCSPFLDDDCGILPRLGCRRSRSRCRSRGRKSRCRTRCGLSYGDMFSSGTVLKLGA